MLGNNYKLKKLPDYKHRREKVLQEDKIYIK